MKDYTRDHIKPHNKEKCYFDNYEPNEPNELEQVIKTQQTIIYYQKEQTHTYLYHIFIVIDDFADDTSFTRKSQLLHQLYTRGRHYMISTITSTQVYKQIPTIVRKSMTHLFIYRLRNYGDLGTIIEEMSATYDKRTLLHMYHGAISEPYSFLDMNLMQKDRSKMFMPSFNNYLLLSKTHFFIISCIMTGLTDSEGKVLNYTGGFIEAILLQLNSSNNYYTTGDDEVTFIKIGLNKILLLYYTYHMKISLQNYTINEHTNNAYDLEFVLNSTSNEYTIQSVYTANGFIGTVTSLQEAFSAMKDTTGSPYSYTGSEHIDITDNQVSLNFLIKANGEIALHPRNYTNAVFEMIGGTGSFTFRQNLIHGGQPIAVFIVQQRYVSFSVMLRPLIITTVPA